MDSIITSDVPAAGLPGLGNNQTLASRVSEGPILIVGQSHLLSFGQGLSTPDGEIRRVSLPGRRAAEVLLGRFPRSTEYWLSALSAARDQTVAICWRGNQHNSGFLFAADPPLDFVSSSLSELPMNPGALLVPELAFKAAFEGTLLPLKRFLEQVARQGCIQNIVLLGSPPPINDNNWIRQCLLSDEFFSKLAARLGQSTQILPLSTPTLRLKIWDLLQRMYADLASSMSCRFVASPPAASTAEGFLARELWSNDATHAGPAYGELVLEALGRELGRSV